MSFAMFVTWVLVGVLAGVLAGLVVKRGSYGLKNDIILGLVGSIGAGWIFRAVGLFPETRIVAKPSSRSSGRPSGSALNASFGPPSVQVMRKARSGNGGWARRSWP
jgi:uncharacterized membrane protein YeaQ/YmgE (transglycosylase-associated protein family)